VHALEEWQNGIGKSPFRDRLGESHAEVIFRHPYSTQGTSFQQLLCCVLLGHAKGVLAHYASLDEQFQQNFAVAMFSALRTIEVLNDHLVWRTPLGGFFPIYHEGKSFSRKLRQEFSSFRKRYGEAFNPVVDVLDLSSHLGFTRLGDVTTYLKDVATRSPVEIPQAYREFFSWVSKCGSRAGRWAAELPPKTHVINIVEYDAQQGAKHIPKEFLDEIAAIQEKVRTPAASRRSGIVIPESTDWFASRLLDHDAIIFSLQEERFPSTGHPHASKKILGIGVASCSQQNPPALLQELKSTCSQFLEGLPQNTTLLGNTPLVLADLVIATQDGKRLLREYGISPYELLDEQFVFNVASKFPGKAFVDCLSICRVQSVALSAHERFGWKDTNEIYTSPEGVSFHILHRRIYPALLILGFPQSEISTSTPARA
jgi:hypothetical protein